jgi:hypothetical protein
MKIKQIYLGTWFQRTSLHLKELYEFLKQKKVATELEGERMEHIWESLNIKNVEFIGNNEFDEVLAQCGKVLVSVTEDGIILLTTDEINIPKAKKLLESFYTEFLAPALSFLFSRGAPLPKVLDQAKSTYPLLCVTEGGKERDILKLYEDHKDMLITRLHGNHLQVCLGEVMSVFQVEKPRKFTKEHTREFLHYIIFFREFEKQLKKYLFLHRTMWEEITAIRDAENMLYKDFPRIREQILQHMKTLSFVKARLAQMKDIMNEREHTIDPHIKEELKSLGLLKFDHLVANQKYISHLWQMTIEYVRSSLSLLESLYQENTQKELNAIKFITFGALVTGFFGMNIAFPWEERWMDARLSSIIVVLIIFSAFISFYYILKITIYNRNFLVSKKKMPDEEIK